MKAPSPAKRGRAGAGVSPPPQRPFSNPPPLHGGGGVRTNARSLLLPFLPPDLLVGVADALALVRLRPTEPADLRRYLADQALVHAFHLDRRRALAGDLDAVRDRIDDRVRIPE